MAAHKEESFGRTMFEEGFEVVQDEILTILGNKVERMDGMQDLLRQTGPILSFLINGSPAMIQLALAMLPRHVRENRVAFNIVKNLLLETAKTLRDMKIDADNPLAPQVARDALLGHFEKAKQALYVVNRETRLYHEEDCTDKGIVVMMQAAPQPRRGKDRDADDAPAPAANGPLKLSIEKCHARLFRACPICFPAADLMAEAKKTAAAPAAPKPKLDPLSSIMRCTYEPAKLNFLNLYNHVSSEDRKLLRDALQFLDTEKCDENGNSLEFLGVMVFYSNLEGEAQLEFPKIFGQLLRLDEGARTGMMSVFEDAGRALLHDSDEALDAVKGLWSSHIAPTLANAVEPSASPAATAAITVTNTRAWYLRYPLIALKALWWPFRKTGRGIRWCWRRVYLKREAPPDLFRAINSSLFDSEGLVDDETRSLIINFGVKPNVKGD